MLRVIFQSKFRSTRSVKIYGRSWKYCAEACEPSLNPEFRVIQSSPLCGTVFSTRNCSKGLVHLQSLRAPAMMGEHHTWFSTMTTIGNSILHFGGMRRALKLEIFLEATTLTSISGSYVLANWQCRAISVWMPYGHEHVVIVTDPMMISGND
jgi:hypothetical protein